MSALGMCALFASVSPTSPMPPSVSSVMSDNTVGKANISKSAIRKNRSSSTAPGLYSYIASPRNALERYIFGYHSKTKRTLAEEAECGNETSVHSWVREGYDPDELDAYGYTPLLNASALGRINAVIELIKNGADVNKPGPYGFTPLHAAAQNGHREVVSALLKKGANINAQNEDKDTPMHLALRSLHIEIVYILFRNGGNAKIQGFMGKDCVQCAKEIGLRDLSQTLKNYNASIGFHPHSSPEIKKVGLNF